MKYIVWLKNRIWHKGLLKKGIYLSPFEALLGRASPLSMARVFGCDVWVYDFNAPKDTVQPRGIKCIFVGVSESRKGWLVLDLKTMKIRTSYHCVFDESLAGRRCALMDRKLRANQGAAAQTPENETSVDDIFQLDDDVMISFEPDSQDEGEKETEQETRVSRPTRNSRIGGSAATESEATPTPRGSTPECIGDRLQEAYDNDSEVEYVQRNPKKEHSKARERYEKYKQARTLREALARGATHADIKWDWERGFLYLVAGSVGATAQTPPVATSEVDDSHQQTMACMFENSMTPNDLERCAHLLETDDLSDEAKLAVDEIKSRSSSKGARKQTAPQQAARIPIPKTRREAMRSQYAQQWREAEEQELSSLKLLGCFQQVSEKQARLHGKLVDSKWVYTVKYNPDGSVQRFKARLVAKGFTQTAGTDYFETFSPVFSYNSLRVVFAISAVWDLRLDVWDLKNGFIQQDIDVPHLYMKAPEGHELYMPDGTRAALQCLKSIYGLKQSSRLLNQRMSAYLAKLGFQKLLMDECVYTRGTSRDYLMVGIWVDDIIVASTRDNEEIRRKFDEDLRKEFTMSPWTAGEAQVFLGIHIRRDWTNGLLHISSERSIEDMAERFELTGREGQSPYVPMDPKLKLTKPPEDEVVPTQVFDYRAAVGAVLYLATTTRPDVAQPIGVLSRFVSCPGEDHVKAIKQVIRYLYGTKTFGITYSKWQSNRPHHPIADPDIPSWLAQLTLVVYADADFAGDESTRRSTTGFAGMLAGAVVFWSSKLQTTVSLSTMEAETTSSTEAVKLIVHQRLMLAELGFPQKDSTIAHEDNSAAMAIVHGENAKRAKHFQIKVHFLREQRERGEFEYHKVGTKDQLADVFTKALPWVDFERFRRWMGVLPAEAISR